MSEKEVCPNSSDGEHNYDSYDDPFGLYCRNCDYKEKYAEYCNKDAHKNLSTQLSAYREALEEAKMVIQLNDEKLEIIASESRLEKNTEFLQAMRAVINARRQMNTESLSRIEAVLGETK